MAFLILLLSLVFNLVVAFYAKSIAITIFALISLLACIIVLILPHDVVYPGLIDRPIPSKRQFPFFIIAFICTISIIVIVLVTRTVS